MCVCVCVCSCVFVRVGVHVLTEPRVYWFVLYVQVGIVYNSNLKPLMWLVWLQCVPGDRVAACVCTCWSVGYAYVLCATFCTGVGVVNYSILNYVCGLSVCVVRMLACCCMHRYMYILEHTLSIDNAHFLFKQL